MIPQHNVMEKENEGRCPVGGVSPHGGEHVNSCRRGATSVLGLGGDGGFEL